jgi:hypothetical protein
LLLLLLPSQGPQERFHGTSAAALGYLLNVLLQQQHQSALACHFLAALQRKNSSSAPPVS